MLIETQRLIIREFQQKDLQHLASILAHPEVMKFSSTGTLSLLQVQNKIENFIDSYKKYGFGKWAVFFKATNELIGYCGIALEIIDLQDEKEIGYRLNRNFWGQGLATEAASATLEYGFKQLQLPYVLGIVEREHIASVKVLKKIGMKYERETIFQGIKMDVYRMNKEIVLN